MNHLFVPYELALLAREKEFDEPCIRKYDLLNKAFYNFTIEEAKDWNKGYRINKANTHELSIPLYQQIIDWFRERHNLFISVFQSGDTGEEYTFRIFECKYPQATVGRGTSSLYYEELDKGIEEAFKLI